MLTLSSYGSSVVQWYGIGYSIGYSTMRREYDIENGYCTVCSTVVVYRSKGSSVVLSIVLW
jgi:hypothetical protein